jgi:hypothetical protein
MNKEEILEAFYKERSTAPQIRGLVEVYGGILTSEIQEPCSLINEAAEDANEDHRTMSRCPEVEKSIRSMFSEIAIDKNVYNDILVNRKKHNVFIDFEEGPLDAKMWYFKDEKGCINGPLSAQQMNDLYQLGKFTEDYAFSKDLEVNFVSFNRFIKKYYAKITPRSEACPAKNHLQQPKRLSIFGKTDLKFTNPILYTNEDKSVRQTRLLSHEVKPNLSFLEDVIEDFEMTDIIQTRGRSSTLDQ